jgi:hypothetical protein
MGFGEHSVDQHEFVALLPECFRRLSGKRATHAPFGSTGVVAMV